MRRLWAFTIVGAFVALGASDAEAQMRLGAKGGVAFSNASLDPDEETESVSGFIGGAEVQIPLGMSGLVLQPELLYAAKGVEFEEIDGITASINIDYVEVPLLVRFNIPAQSVMPFVYAGGVVSFESSCSIEGTDGEVTVDSDCEDAELETESTDFGVLFGGGLAFPVGPGDLFVEGRYTLGLADVIADEDLEAKNRSAAVMVGYSVSLDPTRR